MNGDRIQDEDFVTREEMDDRLQALEVHDDGNTTRIEKTASGAFITCTVPTSPDTARELIFTSTYDPSAETYTIAWRAFYIWLKYVDDTESSSSANKTWKLMEVAASEFVWGRALFATDKNLHFQVVLTGNGLYDGVPVLYWSNDTPSLVGDDASTIAKKTGHAQNTRIGSVVQTFIGGSDITYAALVPIGPNLDPLLAEIDYVYNTSTKVVRVEFWGAPFSSSSAAGVARTLTLGNSFDDFVSIAWNPPSTTGRGSFAFVADASLGSYTDSVQVGRFVTDSSGNLTIGVIWDGNIKHTFGYTGTFVDNGSTTRYVNKGLITK